MTRLERVLASLSVALALTVLPTVGELETSVPVRETWQGVTELLSRGEVERALQFVVPEYRDSSKVHLFFFEWFATCDSFRTAGIEEQEDFWKADAVFTFGESERHKSYFLVERGEQILLTCPFDAYTQHWDTVESEHFLFRFLQGSTHPVFGINYPIPSAVRFLEKHYRRFCNLLGVELREKVKVYMAANQDELRKVFQFPHPAGGLSDVRSKVIGSAGFVAEVPHELVHILQYQLTGNVVVWYLREGIAEYGDGDGGLFMGLLCTQATKKLLEDGEFVPLEKFISSNYGQLPGATIHHEAGSLVKYLIEEHGNVKFRELLLESENTEGFIRGIREIYGWTIEELERNWLEWLENYVEEDVVTYWTHRVILESWERRKAGRFQIYCDPDGDFPTEAQVVQLEKRYLKYCRQNNLEPSSYLTFYLMGSALRARLFFGAESKYFRERSIIVDTTFANTTTLSLDSEK